MTSISRGCPAGIKHIALRKKPPNPEFPAGHRCSGNRTLEDITSLACLNNLGLQGLKWNDLRALQAKFRRIIRGTPGRKVPQSLSLRPVQLKHESLLMEASAMLGGGHCCATLRSTHQSPPWQDTWRSSTLHSSNHRWPRLNSVQERGGHKENMFNLWDHSIIVADLAVHFPSQRQTLWFSLWI